MPGDDPAEAMRVVVGELPDFPHLVELPSGGMGADLIGRGAAHLVDLHVELAVSGWRFVPRPGADERRARSRLVRDLDVLEEQLEGFAGPLKVQCAGPWSLAAAVELHYGDKALADRGAVRDIAAALGEGLAQLTRDVQRRVPGAVVVVQLDEPSLPGALAGNVPTASGFGTLPIVEPADARDKLAVVAGAIERAGGLPVAHCCAATPPVALFAEAGMRAVSLDATLLTEADDDAIGSAIEGGVALFLGLVPPTDVEPIPRVASLAAPARRLWSRLGFAPEQLASNVITPTCGLAGGSPGWPAQAYRLCRQAARELLEQPEEGR